MECLEVALDEKFRPVYKLVDAELKTLYARDPDLDPVCIACKSREDLGRHGAEVIAELNEVIRTRLAKDCARTAILNIKEYYDRHIKADLGWTEVDENDKDICYHDGPEWPLEQVAAHISSHSQEFSDQFRQVFMNDALTAVFEHACAHMVNPVNSAVDIPTARLVVDIRKQFLARR